MKISNTQDFQLKHTQQFFFDSNVWLYLLYPQFNEKAYSHIKKYSSFSNSVFEKESLVLTNLIQVSEMINVILQTEFKIAKKLGKSIDFKTFRKSELGKKAHKQAKTFINQVMKSATLQTGLFNNSEMKAIVADCDKADFNDIYFAKFCEKQDCILVTHDFDFDALNNVNIEVISANRNYFTHL